MKSFFLVAALVGTSFGQSVISCSSAHLCLSAPFVQGTVCAHDNKLWRAKWWINSTPSSSDAAWEYLGTCDGQPEPPSKCEGAVWNENLDYQVPNMEVIYKNKLWRNSWWSNKGDAPDEHTDNWRAIKYCQDDGLPGTSTITAVPTSLTRTESATVATVSTSATVATESTLTTHAFTTQSIVYPTTSMSSASATTTMSTAVTTGSTTRSSPGSSQEIPSGPVGSKGECVWPEWLPDRVYASTTYVGMGQTVYVNSGYANINESPLNGGPWKKVADCVGTPPKARYSEAEMKEMLIDGGKGLQVIYDPWTPLLPTDADIANTQSIHRNTEIGNLVIETTKMRSVAEVEAVVPGRAENPENVRRVESILSGGLFDKFFPVRHKAYSYPNFLKSVALFPAYCGTYSDERRVDSDKICKKVLATSFAHYVQETGANHDSLFYKNPSHTASPDNVNDGADPFYTVGEKIDRSRQALWFLREIGHTEGDGGSAYRACEMTPSNMPFVLNYPCGDNVDYFGRGSKQLSWNYNYGPFSQEVYGDARVLLNDPSKVAETWLNFASGLWFFVTPQSPKPAILWVVDGTWIPNDADKNAGRTAGFGTTTNIINGGLECNKLDAEAPKRRALAYRSFMGEFKVQIPDTEDLECARMKVFDESSSAAFEYNYQRSETGCELTKIQTPWRLSHEGDYANCINYFHRAHWFKDGVLISSYGTQTNQ